MKVSVIIPTFNRANFLPKTISSISEQTIKPNEIIIVDDGSTDNTKELILNLQKKLNNIKYIYQKNQGVSSARNSGIHKASNDWIAFCDSDDIWHKNKLEKQINFHKNNPNILISHTDETWKYNDKIIKKKRYQKKPSGDCFLDNIDICKIGASTIFIYKPVFQEIGLFDTKLIACEDYDLWLRILLKYELGLINEELITKVAGHKGQLSFETNLIDTFRIQALQKHLNSKYHDEVKEELIKKVNILIKGAKKHKNDKILKEYRYYLNNILL